MASPPHPLPFTLPSSPLPPSLSCLPLPPAPPTLSLEQRLNRNGIERVVVGHTPHGDCPTVLRHTVDSQADQRAEAETHECKLDLIMADTSYSDGRAGDDRGNAISTVTAPIASDCF